MSVVHVWRAGTTHSAGGAGYQTWCGAHLAWDHLTMDPPPTAYDLKGATCLRCLDQIAEVSMRRSREESKRAIEAYERAKGERLRRARRRRKA